MNDIRISSERQEHRSVSYPKEGWYLARDTELKGFFIVVVGKRKRTFTVQGDLRQEASEHRH